MTPQLRRSLAALLAGVAGSLIALTTAAWIRRDACLDSGGRWLDAARRCEWAAGAAAGPDPQARAYLVGALVGLAAAAMLWRIYTYVSSRGRRGVPRAG